MISKSHARQYCSESITKIENYEEALKSEDRYDCHHRDEIKVLPSGMKVYRSQKDLIEAGRYWKCPANELIFIRHDDHLLLHGSERPVDHEKASNIAKQASITRIARGNHWHSEETKKKISEAHKGKSSWNKGLTYSNPKVSIALTGKKLSEKTKMNMSKSRTGRKWFNDGINTFFIFPSEALPNYKEGRGGFNARAHSDAS